MVYEVGREILHLLELSSEKDYEKVNINRDLKVTNLRSHSNPQELFVFSQPKTNFLSTRMKSQLLFFL